MKLTTFQQKQKDAFLADHQPSDDLSPVAKSKYLKAVSKITFTPTDEGGLAISYEHLSAEELFAIQEPWGVFTPSSVTSKLRAAAQGRLMDELRKDVLVLAHGETFKPQRQKGAKGNETNAQNEYIKAQMLGDPDAKAFKLYEEADKKIIGTMSFGTYQGRVTEIRKLIKAELKN